MLDELKQQEIKSVTVSLFKKSQLLVSTFHIDQVAMLNCLIKRNHNLAVVFLDETTSDDEVLLAELENIDGETKKYDIDFVKVGCLIPSKRTMTWNRLQKKKVQINYKILVWGGYQPTHL